MFQLIQILSVIPKSGVFALVNNQSNNVYLAYSNNILTYIVRLLFDVTNIKYRKVRDDIEKLEFVMLFESNDKDEMIQQYSYYVDHYKDINYTFYREYTPVKYKLIKEVIEKNIVISLIAKNGKKKVMGVFCSKKEADLFVKTYYSTSYLKPVLCNNELTKQFLMKVV